jgi:hypothetical protein
MKPEELENLKRRVMRTGQQTRSFIFLEFNHDGTTNLEAGGALWDHTILAAMLERRLTHAELVIAGLIPGQMMPPPSTPPPSGPIRLIPEGR